MKKEESQLQTAVINWWQLAHRGLGVPDERLLYMVPNGAYFGGGVTARGVPIAAIRAHAMKAQGMRSGIPDLCLAVMRHGHGALYLEMKTPTGATSPAQRELHALLTAQGYRVVVPRTFDQAVAAITLYLSVNITTALT